MKKKRSLFKISILFTLFAIMLSGCATGSAAKQTDSSAVEEEVAEEKKEAEDSSSEVKEEEDDDYTEGLAGTFEGDTKKPSETVKEEAENEEVKAEEAEEDEENENLVDLIFFMGQSNMSGCGGDAALAPLVPEKNGYEYRSVSDPTRLYPITEPFGINENRIGGLFEYPNGKKGSIVSAFVNEYHDLTKRKVVAVSVSKGETSISDFLAADIMADVEQRFSYSKSYLSNNGYEIGHIYVVWLQGESDSLEGTNPEVYKTKLDDFFRPMFIEGLEKVFIITPGRTYDYKNIYRDIVNAQQQVCKESGYYALATTILGGVSTEYMVDMYHYNQHVLNLVGIESAKSLAYYTMNGEEKIVFDYFNKEYIVPSAVAPDSQEWDKALDLSKINDMY